MYRTDLQFLVFEASHSLTRSSYQPDIFPPHQPPQALPSLLPAHVSCHITGAPSLSLPSSSECRTHMSAWDGHSGPESRASSWPWKRNVTCGPGQTGGLTTVGLVGAVGAVRCVITLWVQLGHTLAVPAGKGSPWTATWGQTRTRYLTSLHLSCLHRDFSLQAETQEQEKPLLCFLVTESFWNNLLCTN